MPKEKGMPGVVETFEKLKELHLSKNADYATSANRSPYFNFDVTEIIIKLFSNDRDKTFVWPIANKLARLAVLLSSDKEPNNESVDDSLDDIAVYAVMWKSDINNR